MRKPPAELTRFLAPYGPEVARLFLASRKAVLEAAPAATELIYDAYNAVTIAYSFTDRLKEAFCHTAAYRGYVNLGFNRGADLADPHELLVGTGAKIRHVRISTPADLRRPGVPALLRAAVAQGRSLAGDTPAKPRSIVVATRGKKRRPPAS